MTCIQSPWPEEKMVCCMVAPTKDIFHGYREVLITKRRGAKGEPLPVGSGYERDSITMDRSRVTVCILMTGKNEKFTKPKRSPTSKSTSNELGGRMKRSDILKRLALHQSARRFDSSLVVTQMS